MSEEDLSETPEGLAETKKILVIEDDPSVRTSVSALLSKNRFQVLTASEWTEALDTLEAERPDLMLLDLVMPVIDGLKLLQYMREQGITTPVIVVSASIDTSAREQLNELNISAFVAKPFRVATLVREIWRALHPPLFLGEVKYVEGSPVILEEYIAEDPARRQRRRRRRRSPRSEAWLPRVLRRIRRKYPLLNLAMLLVVVAISMLLAWLLSS